MIVLCIILEMVMHNKHAKQIVMFYVFMFPKCFIMDLKF